MKRNQATAKVPGLAQKADKALGILPTPIREQVKRHRHIIQQRDDF